MLDDRPDMVGVLAADDPIVEWVVAGMNGDRIGQRIYWHGASPQSGQPAEHASPYSGYPPHISLQGGTETTGIDKWSGLVFELFNLEGTEAFAELHARALAGEVDGETYANEATKLEFVALKRTEEFFRKRPMPGAKPGRNRLYEGMLDLPATYEEYLVRLKQEYPKGSYHPVKYYQDYYESSIVPYREMTERGGSSAREEPVASGGAQ